MSHRGGSEAIADDPVSTMPVQPLRLWSTVRLAMAVLLAPPTLRAEGEQSLAKTSQNPVGYETTDGREMKCVW